MKFKELLNLENFSIRNPLARILYSSVPIATATFLSYQQQLSGDTNKDLVSALTTAGVLIAPFVSLAGETLAEAISDKFFKNYRRKDILENGDLQKAVGDAICANILEIYREKNLDVNQTVLKKLSNVPVSVWQDLIVELETEKAIEFNLSLKDIDKLMPRNLPDIFAFSATEFNKSILIDRNIWEKILRKFCLLRGISTSNENNSNFTDTIELASIELEKNFPELLKHTIISNVTKDQKAYANLQLKINGEILYFVRKNDKKTDEILEIVKQLQQRNIELELLFSVKDFAPDSQFFHDAYNLTKHIYEVVVDTQNRVKAIDAKTDKILAILGEPQDLGNADSIREYEFERCKTLKWLRKEVDMQNSYQFLPMLETKYIDAIESNLGEDEDGFTSAEFGSLSETQKKILGTLEYGDKFSISQVFSNFKGVVENKLSQTARDKLVYSEIPRFLLLGEPGCGKSAFCKYLAFQCQNQFDKTASSNAQKEIRLIGKSKKPFIPVYIKLSEWEDWAVKNDFHLQNYLVKSLYESVDNAPTEKQWREFLSSGDVLLLLDGLDETLNKKDSSFKIADELNKKASTCPTVITCRTFSYNTHKPNFLSYPIFSLGGLISEQQDIIIKKYTEITDSNLKKLRRQLDNSPEISVLAQNTLLLTIICFIISSNKTTDKISLPKTRTKLYVEAVNKLLDKKTWDRYPTDRPENKLNIEENNAILAELAYRLWTSTIKSTNNKRKISFTGKEIKKTIDDLLDSKEFKYLRSSVNPENILEDYSKYGGILLGEIDEPYGFLHLTFFEYLVAFALAGKEDYLDIIEKHIYEPSWNVVLMLLGGTLAERKEKNPDDFIQYLIDKDQGIQRRPFFKAIAAAVEANSSKLPDLTRQLYDLKIGYSRTSGINEILLDRTIRLVSKHILPIIFLELRKNNHVNKIVVSVEILQIIFSPYTSDAINIFLLETNNDRKFLFTQNILKNLLKKMEKT